MGAAASIWRRWIGPVLVFAVCLGVYLSVGRSGGSGDTLPARQLYERLYARIPSTRDVCAYGDGEVRGYEWRACGGPEGNAGYPKARAAKLGIRG